jgi:serine/threonine-protein kinase
MVMGTAMYVSPEQATGAKVTDSSDIYSLGVVAYECLAGHPPFTASEPLAIAFAHKHEPVPPLPPDVPPPVSDLVYHMLAKTPEERPASMRAVADRADVLRGALALGETAESAAYPGATAAYPGATRADLPTTPTGAGSGEDGPGFGEAYGSRRRGRRRQLVAVGSTAVLCAAAIATGLYLTSHNASPATGDVRSNTAQHLSSPPVTPTSPASSPSSPSLSPSPSLARVLPSKTPRPAGNPKPSKTPKPTKSPTASPTASSSDSTSASPTPTDTSSPTTSPSSPTSSPPTTSERN